MSDELEIPDAAWEAAWNVPAPAPDGHDLISAYAKRCVVAAAPLIVAAELEQLARDLIEQWGAMRADDVRGFGLNEAIQQIQARAAELRGTPNEQ